MEWIQVISGAATIIGANYGMLKFMLKDVHKEVAILERDSQEFKEELRHNRNRMDGLYRVILDRTYGKNIPEELK